MSIEAKQRAAVVREALTWQRTPWHHHACVKGTAVDCGRFMLAVFKAAGVIEYQDPAPYSRDWMMHNDESLFLAEVEKYASRVYSDPFPGDIALFKYGQCISHGAIVIDWPQIIHAYAPARCVTLDTMESGILRKAFVGIWRIKSWAA